jgi:hypothetical protein
MTFDPSVQHWITANDVLGTFQSIFKFNSISGLDLGGPGVQTRWLPGALLVFRPFLREKIGKILLDLCISNITASLLTADALTLFDDIALVLNGVSIRRLDVSFLAIGEIGVNAILRLITEGIEVVDISNCGLNAFTMRLIANSLAARGAHQTLQAMRMERNRIGHGGVVALAELIEACKALKSLSIGEM